MTIPDSDSDVAVITGQRFATWRMADGIVRLMITHSELAGPDAEQILEALARVSDQTSVPICADITRLREISREVRTTMASDTAAQLIEIAAVIVSNPINRMLGQFFIRLNKPRFEMKLCDDYQGAVQWLLQHRPQPDR